MELALGVSSATAAAAPTEESQSQSPEPEPEPRRQQNRQPSREKNRSAVSVAAVVCAATVAFFCAVLGSGGTGAALADGHSAPSEQPQPQPAGRPRSLDFPLVARAAFDDLSQAEAALAGTNLDVMGRGRRRRGGDGSVVGQVERTFLLRDAEDWVALESVLSTTSGGGRIELDVDHTDLMKSDEAEERYRGITNRDGEEDEEEGRRRISDANAGGYETMSSRPCYRTVDATYRTMDDIVAAHPTLASVVTIGSSVEEEGSMRVLRLTNQNSTSTDKAPMFVTAGLHAREYAPTELVTRFAEHIVTAYGTDADITWILDHVVISLVLQSNPDSRRIAERNDPSSGFQPRKNRMGGNGCSAFNGLGTDLNRNFDFMWGRSPGGSSADPCNITYRGGSAESDPETVAIASYSRTIFPEGQRKVNPVMDVDVDYDEETSRGIFVDVHAYGNDVIFPWGYKDEAVSNFDAYKAIAHKLSKINGYGPSGSGYNFLGTTSGDTLDYHHGALGVASILFELGVSFYESCDSFHQTVLPDNLEALVYGAKLARLPFSLAKGPDVMDLAVEPADEDGSSTFVTVTARATDSEMTELGTNNPDIDNSLDTGAQNIASVVVFVDDHPYDAPPPNSTSMQPQDGSFDSPTEAVTLTLDTSNLAGGRHTVCVEATDDDGYKGPVTCRYFNVKERVGNCKVNATCEDCLDQSCAWAPVAGCLPKCSIIADTSCYSSDSLNGTTSEDICTTVAGDNLALENPFHDFADGGFMYETRFDSNTTDGVVKNRRAKVIPVPKGKAGRNFNQENVLEVKLSSKGKSVARDTGINGSTIEDFITLVDFQITVGMTRHLKGEVTCQPRLGLVDESGDLTLNGGSFVINKDAHKRAQIVQKTLTIPPGRTGLKIDSWTLICTVKRFKRLQKLLVAEVKVSNSKGGDELRKNVFDDRPTS